MTMEEKLLFKDRLKQFCQERIEQRMIAAKQAIKNAQESANSEEKSSAGDKYETSRAMGHLQKDMHARQLSEYIKELSNLLAVNANIIYDFATAGAFIETDQASFFIAAGLGKQIVDDKAVIFLSPNAPLSNTLLNKKQGDEFVFNKNTVIVREVY